VRNFLFVLTISSLTLLSTNSALSYLPAQAKGNILKNEVLLIATKKCGNTNPVKPSKTTKTVKFPQYGIKVKIPSNFKTITRKDGYMSILDPGTYEAVKCQAPHGIYSFNIDVLPNPKNLSLQAFAKSNYKNQPMRVHNYSQNNIKALLLDSEGGYSSYGIFKVPSVKGIVEMNASCDCEVDKTDIISYLKVTELIR
jgi:hypothetical protein